MTSAKLARMAEAAAVIRQVIGGEFEWEPPGHRRYAKTALMVLLHEPGSKLRPYCNYDCCEYGKIEQLVDALSPLGLFVEDANGDYSGLHEVSQ